MNIVFLGPPGAGKGTQAERVAERLGVSMLATGNVLRSALREGTPMGLAAKAYMERGDLVPDEVILGIIKEALSKPGMEKGVILDGVVRTVPQAEGLTRTLGELGRRLDAVVMFEVGDEELVRRLGGRTVCDRCQTPYTGLQPGTPCPKGDGGTLVRRKDDEPEAIRQRMRAYRDQTQPVVDWYRNGGSAKGGAQSNGARFLTVDAVGSMDDVTDRVLRALGR